MWCDCPGVENSTEGKQSVPWIIYWEVVSDEIVVSQSPAHKDLLNSKNITIINTIKYFIFIKLEYIIILKHHYSTRS